MKVMKRNLINEMRQGAVKIAENVAMKVGESTVEGCCMQFFYEPKMPSKLLEEIWKKTEE